MNDELIDELIWWIEKNIEKKLSINIVAMKSGYSKWYLQRMFKQKTNISLGKYLLMRRLIHSAIELKETNNMIIEISIKYNFDSQQSYCRSFKKLFGLSPNNYRVIHNKLFTNKI